MSLGVLRHTKHAHITKYYMHPLHFLNVLIITVYRICLVGQFKLVVDLNGKNKLIKDNVVWNIWARTLRTLPQIILHKISTWINLITITYSTFHFLPSGRKEKTMRMRWKFFPENSKEIRKVAYVFNEPLLLSILDSTQRK